MRFKTTVAAPTADAIGSVQVVATTQSGTRDQSRRNTITATLDGSSVVEEFGYTDTDRTIRVTVNAITKADFDTMSYLNKTYTEVTIARREAVFLCAPTTISLANGVAVFSAAIKQKLSA